MNSQILKYLLAGILAAIATIAAKAQTDAQFTQYWAVQNYYNPAVIGTTDNISIKAGSRVQWLGIDNAPMSFNALGDMPFKFLDKRWAVGANLSHQSMGLYRSINAAAQLAFRKRMLKGELSIGVQVGIINETFKGTEVFIPSDDEYHETADDAIPQQDIAGTGFDASAGVHFTHKYFWVGISATHVNQPSISLRTENSEDDLYEFKAGRTYYFMMGGNIPIKNTLFELQPSVFFKTDAQYWTAEATARLRYKKFLSAGVSYRCKDAVAFIIGAELKGVTLGYSYDFPVSNIIKGTSGSHELWLGYNLKLNLGEKNKNKHKSIRLM